MCQLKTMPVMLGLELHLVGFATILCISIAQKNPQNHQDLNISVSGVSGHENLNWETQCNSLNSKLNSYCFVIRNYFEIKTTNIWLQCPYRIQVSLWHRGESTCLWSNFCYSKKGDKIFLGYQATWTNFKELGILILAGIFIYEICEFVFLKKLKFSCITDVHDHFNRLQGIIFERSSVGWLSAKILHIIWG